VKPPAPPRLRPGPHRGVRRSSTHSFIAVRNTRLEGLPESLTSNICSSYAR
jgi:hypothetical protein